jgi:arabinan endo-1,5-alpha-L-arabinosidase
MRNGKQLLLALLIALANCLAPAFLQGAPADTNSDSGAVLTAFGRREPRVHDPSTIVRCGDEFWLFATGFGVVSWHSKDLVDWQSGPRVFTNNPRWAANAVPGNRGYLWAPDVIHLTNRYLLYYSVSTFGKNTSVIGLATSPTLDPANSSFAWSDQGIVVQSRFTNDFNAIDPAAVLDAEGHLWLVFGSFWSGVKLIQLDPATGKRLAPDSPIYALARHDSIEAAAIYQHADRYYLFVNWGACCRGTNSTYNIRIGRSSKITGPYLDKDGVDLRDGGGTLLVGTTGPFIGPGHAAIFSEAGSDWLSCHFYDGTRAGRPTLAIRPLRWSPDGWPEAGLHPSK